MPTRTMLNLMKQSVCVIDDDADVRFVICTCLEQAGLVTSQARNGKEGLEAITRTGCALAIVDILMPTQEGLLTISLAREQFPDLKILAISGGGRSGAESYLTLAKAMGADAVLSKPFRTEALLRAVSDLIGA